MHYLILDAGSTKTDVGIVEHSHIKQITVSGINPNLFSEEMIKQELYIIQDYLTEHNYAIFHYGAGIGSEYSYQKLHAIYKSVFPNSTAYIHNDIVAAAIAVGQGENCYAGILGTGSNFCSYINKEPKFFDRSVGFIAGDEGSGNAIGKALVRDFMYGRIPEELKLQLNSDFWNPKTLVPTLYQHPKPNMLLASLVKESVAIHSSAYFQAIVKEKFTDYVLYQLCSAIPKEKRSLYPVGFVGSIAANFQAILKEVLHEYGFIPGKFVQRPIEELIQYHSRNQEVL